MRTQEEILKKIAEVQPNDIMGFEWTSLLNFLTYENAKQFLKEDVTESEWVQETKSPKEVMIDYMEFAWGKANDERGISAYRSIAHYMAWLWLDGNEELAEEIEDYNDYGKPQLAEICRYLGLDYKQYIEY